MASLSMTAASPGRASDCTTRRRREVHRAAKPTPQPSAAPASSNRPHLQDLPQHPLAATIPQRGPRLPLGQTLALEDRHDEFARRCRWPTFFVPSFREQLSSNSWRQRKLGDDEVGATPISLRASTHPTSRHSGSAVATPTATPPLPSRLDLDVAHPQSPETPVPSTRRGDETLNRIFFEKTYGSRRGRRRPRPSK